MMDVRVRAQHPPGEPSLLSDRPLRVAMLMSSASRLNAGVFEAARGLSCALAQAPYLNVEVFAVEDRFTDEDRARWNGVPVHAFARLGPAAFAYAPGLTNAVEGFAPDIAHVHGPWTYASLLAWRLAERRGAKRIVSAHGMLTPWALRHRALKKTVALRLYEKRSLERADCIHATSEDELRQLRAFGLNQAVAVVPLGINPTLTSKRSNSGDVRTVLSLGRLHPVKGLDRLLLAWAKISTKHQNWRLKIVGPSEHSYRQTLSQICNEAGCARVEFADQLSGDEKERAFLEADLFVLPSLSENFAITVLEALSHGMPVIASRASPWQGLVAEQCGWWVEPQPEPLAEALDKAMQLRQSELLQMGQRGRAWIERDFSWECIGGKMRSVYAWLADGAKKPECVIS